MNNSYEDAIPSLSGMILIAKEAIRERDLNLINNIQNGDKRLIITSDISTSLIKNILKETKANILRCSEDEMYDIVESTYPFVVSKLLTIKESDLFGFTDGYKCHYLFYKNGGLVKILKMKE
jgi:hypothetical protein